MPIPRNKRCPNCGYLLTPGWVDAQLFWDSIKNLYVSGTGGHTARQTPRLNDVPLDLRDRNLIASLRQDRKKAIRLDSAERILAHSNLDPHIPDEIFLQD